MPQTLTAFALEHTYILPQTLVSGASWRHHPYSNLKEKHLLAPWTFWLLSPYSILIQIRRPPRSSACQDSWAVSLPLLHSLPNCYPLLPTPCNSRYYPILRWSYGIDSIKGTGLGRLSSLNPTLMAYAYFTLLTLLTLLTIWEFLYASVGMKF